MRDMRNLYQEVILDHNRKPRNFGPLEGCTCSAVGDNPLCGDNYTVYVNLSDGVVKGVSFSGSGCAISKAAASMMTVKVKGKTLPEAEELIQEFRDMLTGDLDIAGEHHLGHLTVFEGVSQLPQRVKCAVLPWHTLKGALHGEQVASTEGAEDVWAKE